MMISKEQATQRFSSSLPPDGNLQSQILKGVCNEQRRSSSISSAARFQKRISSFLTILEGGGDVVSEAVDLNALVRLKRKGVMAVHMGIYSFVIVHF
jgi:hypothetical protein